MVGKRVRLRGSNDNSEDEGEESTPTMMSFLFAIDTPCQLSVRINKVVQAQSAKRLASCPTIMPAARAPTPGCSVAARGLILFRRRLAASNETAAVMLLIAEVWIDVRHIQQAGRSSAPSRTGRSLSHGGGIGNSIRASGGCTCSLRLDILTIQVSIGTSAIANVLVQWWQW